MKKMKNTLLVLVLLFTVIGKTYAQPDIRVYYGPNYCIGSQVEFGAFNYGEENLWDFNGEGQSKQIYPRWFQVANAKISISTIVN